MLHDIPANVRMPTSVQFVYLCACCLLGTLLFLWSVQTSETQTFSLWMNQQKGLFNHIKGRFLVIVLLILLDDTTELLLTLELAPCIFMLTQTCGFSSRLA